MRTCAACGEALPPASSARRRFCTHGCREAARLRREQGLPENTPRVRPGGKSPLRKRVTRQGERR